VPAAGAQQYQRRATFLNGGDRDHGKCTIEVVVDGAAEIDIRGDQGVIRNLSGQPAQWRRFECTGALPANAPGFRFAGVDGRGRQQLVREPRNGSPAVVRIEDPQGGSEGYTFDIFWGSGYNEAPPPGRMPAPIRRFTTEQAVATCQDSVRQQARFRGRRVEFRETRLDDQPGRNDWVVGVVDTVAGFNSPEEHMRFSCSVNFDTGQVRSVDLQPMGGYGRGRRFTTEQAVSLCQDAVRQQALTRYRGRGIEFRETRLDDQPGRNDWVIGTVDVLRGGNAPQERLRFSCSVDFDNGQVRTVDLTPMGEGRGGGRVPVNVVLENCQSAVRDRMQRDNYGRVEFPSIRMDDQPGRNDWVVGTVRADRGRGSDLFNFSCAVDLRNGSVGSVDVTRR
jgi:hypothetical protein